ncbi:MAG: class I tRNA ligase family protein, partial [Candidatus Uhrbacteria bacterium]|nr:class I tRNA ligase family protein [Candidatus Uhrbacteria bacterium]
MKYDPQKIEKKWQKEWEKQELYKTPDSGKGENYMLLTEFPYPSGNLHIGHWYAFALPDMRARYLRMKGHNVMYPIGFDAFGLPAENAAIKNNVSPRDWTEGNIEYMTKQLQSMGASFDWSRQVSTIDSDYYRWTQWIFLEFYKKGLAYRAKTKVNWCPIDKTVLANEQVIDGKCERDGTSVEQREIEQWMFKITEYADRLIDDLEGLDWPETTKLAQKNWIGRSQGALIKFAIAGQDKSIEAFTTRPDTIYGATFLVISPEKAGELLELSSDAAKYINEALSKRELERLEQKEKTGIPSGFHAINPATEKEIPIWIADYVIGSYGTGAIMAVPAHDERDGEFAKKFNLPISDAPLHDAQEVIAMLQGKGMGETKTNYRLRDWVLSRQRYWGVPIPMIHCESCGYQPVSEKELPVELPHLDDFKPADDGRSPLAKAKDWVQVKCPKCGNDAERETDTMDTFVDSSWYFMRYTDPANAKAFADTKKMDAWLPVPMYVGGAEHNTMHLLYSRFFTKALKDLGYISFNEPFLTRRNHGIILGPDGQKMSKSRENVVDPDEQVNFYGADTVRMYLAFMAPYEQGGPCDPKGINGVHRFMNRVWKLSEQDFKDSASSKKAIHHAIKKVGEDLDKLRLNTAVSELMKALNEIEYGITKEDFESFVKILAPLAPHIAEELWHVLGHDDSIHLQTWPEYDETFLIEDQYQMPVQVNGKLRDMITVSSEATEDEIKKLTLASEKVQKAIDGKEVQK